MTRGISHGQGTYSATMTIQSFPFISAGNPSNEINIYARKLTPIKKPFDASPVSESRRNKETRKALIRAHTRDA